MFRNVPACSGMFRNVPCPIPKEDHLSFLTCKTYEQDLYMDVFWVGVADRAAKSHAPGVIQLVVFSQKKKPEL